MQLELDRDMLFDIIQKRQASLSDFWNNRELLESPIEAIVFDHLFKFKNDNVELVAQKTVKTISGIFRPDIILKLGNREISIECDGEEFHKDDYYDEWRDTLILVSSNIQSIFRLKGKDIHFDLNDIVYFIAIKEPTFFNMDMINRLKPSIRPEFLDRDEMYDCGMKKRTVYEDFSFEEDTVRRMIEIIWRNLSKSFDRFCYREILISYLNPGKTIEELKTMNNLTHIHTNELFLMFYEKYPEYKRK